MMKNRLKITTLGILSFFSMALVLSSCFDDPEFPDEPRIFFENLRYVSQEVSGALVDSLVLVIGFEDGDGDLGLDGTENSPPFNARHYFSNKTGTFINFQTENLEDLLVLANRDDPNFDTIPPFEGNPEACLYWDDNPQITIQGPDGPVALDTIAYYQRNDRHFNIFVRFFNDGANGQPADGVIDEENEEFDFRTLSSECGDGYDGRFPILSDDLSESTALEGTISYSMVQAGPFNNGDFFFGDRLTNIRVHILDRNGNRSNVVESGPFRIINNAIVFN